MSDQTPVDPAQMSEEELRAAYEAQLDEQMKHLRVEDVLVQTIVTLVNLGGRRAGLAPGTEDERDPEQLRLAVEGARVLLPIMESELGPDGQAIRQAISQLQMAYVQLTGGQPPAPGAPAAGVGGADAPATPPPSRLWVPGQ